MKLNILQLCFLHHFLGKYALNMKHNKTRFPRKFSHAFSSDDFPRGNRTWRIDFSGIFTRAFIATKRNNDSAISARHCCRTEFLLWKRRTHKRSIFPVHLYDTVPTDTCFVIREQIESFREGGSLFLFDVQY